MSYMSEKKKKEATKHEESSVTIDTPEKTTVPYEVDMDKKHPVEPEKSLTIQIAEWYESAQLGTPLEEAAKTFNMPTNEMKHVLISLNLTDKIAYPR